MTIINFPGGGHRRDDEVERAAALKRRLVEFVTRGPMRETHAAEMRDTGLEDPEFHEFIDFTDWFIFEWESEDGATVLDEFAAATPDLSDEDRRLLESWYDAIDDVFRVVTVAPEGVTLRDNDGASYFAVPTNATASELGWRENTLVHTRLVPAGDAYLLSGIQSFYDGTDLEDLPEGIDLSAFGRVLDGEDDDEDDEIELAVPDVRRLEAAERAPGSVAEAAHAWLAETADAVKAETADAHAYAVSLLAHYAADATVAADELSHEDLLEFLAVWYPRAAADRGLGVTRGVLSSVGKFTAWLGKRYGTEVGAEYKRRVLPALKDDLPRTIKSVEEFNRYGAAFGVFSLVTAVAQHGDAAHAGRPHASGEAFRARYAIVAVQGNSLTLRERTGETEPVSPLATTEVPHAAAALLRPGDVVEGLFVAAPNARVVVKAVACVYCPASGV